MEQEKIREKIKKIFEDIFPGEPFAWDKKQDQFPQWDSLSHMELAGRAEEETGARFEMEEVMGLNSPEDFVAIISKKLEHGQGHHP